MDENGPDTLKLPLDFRIPEWMSVSYVTTVVAQHTEHEFVISFFEVTPPLIVGDAEDVRRRQHEYTSVPATCVARVALAPARMEQLISVLQENLENYRNRFGTPDVGRDDE